LSDFNAQRVVTESLWCWYVDLNSNWIVSFVLSLIL